VTLFYLTVTTILYKVAELPFQAALAIGFALSLLLHFTLQRLVVWINEDGFALPFRGQLGRYAVMAGAQYGTTVASTALLPAVLGISTEIDYLLTMAVVTSIGFLLMRFVIFHPQARAAAPVSSVPIDGASAERGS
jgi:putative flippase GtrA